MSRKRIKQYLMLLTVVGLIAVAANGSGTFASFSAEATNAGNKFDTGTLFLSNETGLNGTACFSYGAGAGQNNQNGSCNAFIDESAGAGHKPGDNIVTGTITLKNPGTLDASTLTLTPTGCTDSVVTTLGTLNSATGNPLCGATVMYVEETGQIDGSSNSTSYTYCWFGYSTDTNTTCDKTKADLNTNNTSTITAAGTTPIELKPLTASGTQGTGSELAAGATRTFEVGLYLPQSATNAVQGLESNFGLTWHIDQ